MKTTPKNLKRSKAKVELVHGSKSKLRHFKLVKHQHTFKLLSIRHTSHASLMILLAVVGVLVFITTQGGVFADQQNVSHDVTITGIVPGPPPVNGATITTPSENDTYTDQTTIEVDGTCEDNTYVVVFSNATSVGSTNCTSGGIFAVSVDLSEGSNVLTAKNYDTLNQPGPDTPSVKIMIKITHPAAPDSPSSTNQQPEPAVPQPQPPIPEIPENPSVIPALGNGEPTCDEYVQSDPLPIGDDPKVVVVCIPRLFQQDQTYSIGFLVYGGTPPYAVDINWGDGVTPDKLISITQPGYKAVPITYAKPGNYSITATITDTVGNTSVIHSATSVTGQTSAPGTTGAVANKPTGISGVVAAILASPLISTPVPVYTSAVTLTAGFWGGEVFHQAMALPDHFRLLRKIIKFGLRR